MKQQEREKFSCEDKLESWSTAAAAAPDTAADADADADADAEAATVAAEVRLSLSHKKETRGLQPRISHPRTITGKKCIRWKKQQKSSDADTDADADADADVASVTQKSLESSNFGRSDPDLINQRNRLISHKSFGLEKAFYGKLLGRTANRAWARVPKLLG